MHSWAGGSQERQIPSSTNLEVSASVEALSHAIISGENGNRYVALQIRPGSGVWGDDCSDQAALAVGWLSGQHLHWLQSESAFTGV